MYLLLTFLCVVAGIAWGQDGDEWLYVLVGLVVYTLLSIDSHLERLRERADR